MNTATHLAVRPISPQTAFRGAALGTLFTLAPALAEPPAVPADDIRVAKVSLAGLDLSTPEGARVAYERIKTTAEHLCFQLEDRFEEKEVYFDCINEAVAETVRRINAPTLAALKK